MKINNLMNVLFLLILLMLCVGAVSADEGASAIDIPSEDAQTLIGDQDSISSYDAESEAASQDSSSNLIDDEQSISSEKPKDTLGDGETTSDSQPDVFPIAHPGFTYVISEDANFSDETYKAIGVWASTGYYETAMTPWLMNDTTWAYCIHPGVIDPDGYRNPPGIYQRITLTDEQIISRTTNEDILPFIRTLIYKYGDDTEDFYPTGSGKPYIQNIIFSFFDGNYRNHDSHYNREIIKGKYVYEYVDEVIALVESGQGVNNSGVFNDSDFLSYQFYLYLPDHGRNIVPPVYYTDYGYDYQQLIGFNVLTKIDVTKEWDDDESSNRPESIEVQLYADDEKVGDVVKLNASDDWTYTFTDLPVYYSYNTTRLLTSDDYTVISTSEPYDYHGEQIKDITCKITNDEFMQDDWVMEMFYKDSAWFDIWIHVTRENDWTFVISGIPAELDDTDLDLYYTYSNPRVNVINYTIKEVNVPENYETTIESSKESVNPLMPTVNEDTGTYQKYLDEDLNELVTEFTITNKYVPPELHPNMTIEKVTNDKEVKVGDKVSFTVTVKNTGDCNLTGVYIKDTEYSEGLEYDSFKDSTGKWNYKGDGLWEYDGILAPGESASLEIIFTALTVGEKENTAVAGNNLTNDTVNSTNTTNVTDEPEPEEPVPEEPVPEEGEPEEPVPEEPVPEEGEPEEPVPEEPVVTKSVLPPAGNPLFALALVLIVVVLTPLRRKK